MSSFLEKKKFYLMSCIKNNFAPTFTSKTLLADAIRTGDLDFIKYVFSFDVKHLFSELSEHGNTILHEALRTEDLEIIKFVFSLDVKHLYVEKNSFNLTILHKAVLINDLKIIKYIFSLDVFHIFHLVDDDGNTFLHTSLHTGLVKNDEVIKYLFSRHVKNILPVKNNENDTVFHLSIKTGNISTESIKHILSLAHREIFIEKEGILSCGIVSCSKNIRKILFTFYTEYLFSQKILTKEELEHFANCIKKYNDNQCF